MHSGEAIRVVIEDSSGLWTSVLAFGGSVVVAVVTAIAVVIAARRNAQSIIDAEQARHEHDLAAAARTWQRDQRADAYFRMLDAAHRLQGAAGQVVWFFRPVEGKESYESVSTESAGNQIDAWNKALDDLRLAAAAVQVVGDPKIAEYCPRLMSSTHKTLDKAKAAIARAAEEGPQTYDHKAVGRRSRARTRRLNRALAIAIRADLTEPTPTQPDASPSPRRRSSGRRARPTPAPASPDDARSGPVGP